MPYSLGPRSTTGGRPPKLSNGGGEVVDHSSEVASHGLSGALGPRSRLRIRLKRKISWAAPVNRAAIELIFLFNLIRDRKSTRLNSSHLVISYAVFCLKKKKTRETRY